MSTRRFASFRSTAQSLETSIPTLRSSPKVSATSSLKATRTSRRGGRLGLICHILCRRTLVSFKEKFELDMVRIREPPCQGPCEVVKEDNTKLLPFPSRHLKIRTENLCSRQRLLGSITFPRELVSFAFLPLVLRGFATSAVSLIFWSPFTGGLVSARRHLRKTHAQRRPFALSRTTTISTYAET